MKPGITRLQHGITDDLTLDWKSLLSLADIAPLFIFSRDENHGKKLNRIYLYFKLTLCYIKAKLGLFEKVTAESQVSLESYQLPTREPVETINSPGHRCSPTTPSTV